MKKLFFFILILTAFTSSVKAVESKKTSFVDSVALRIYCRIGIVFNQDIRHCLEGSTSSTNLVSSQSYPEVAASSIQVIYPVQVAQTVVEKPIERFVYVQGAPGPQGIKGEQGTQGLSGSSGTAFTGIAMPFWNGSGASGSFGGGGSGPAGPVGPQGLIGVTGTPGTTTVIYSFSTSTGDITATGTIPQMDL